jgi:hypothetical protein
MGTRAFESQAWAKAELQILARDLRSETSAGTILIRLKALNAALEDEKTADQRALVFLRNGGLRTIVRLIRVPPATSDPTADPDSLLLATRTLAAEAFNRLLHSDAVVAEMRFVKGIVLPSAP